MQQLQRYYFPGNIRELEHIIERAVLINDGDELKIELPLANARSADEKNNDATDKKRFVSLEEMERAYIQEVVDHTRGQVEGKGGAAEILSMPSSTLRSRMKKLGLK